VADITVSAVDGTFAVEVRAGRSDPTHHAVTVPPGYAEALGWDRGDEQLVRASFEFLLEREPATSILRRFSLDVIEGYFPEYRTDITARRLG